MPTYTAFEILEMAKTMDVESFRIIAELVDDEIDYYSQDDLIILMQASIIMFTRTMLKMSVKNL